MAFSSFSSFNRIININTKKKVSITTTSILTTTSGPFAISKNGQCIVNCNVDLSIKVSTDYGQTFTGKTSLPQACNKLSISNNGNLILATNWYSIGRCYLSKDGGTSWSTITSSNMNLASINDSGMSETGVYMYVVAYGTGPGIYVSSDSGNTFTNYKPAANDYSSGGISKTGQNMYLKCNGYHFLNTTYGSTLANWTRIAQSTLSSYPPGSVMSGDGLVIVLNNDNASDVFVIDQTIAKRAATTVYTTLNYGQYDGQCICMNNDGSEMYCIKGGAAGNSIYKSTDKLTTITTFYTSTQALNTAIKSSNNCKYILTKSSNALYLTTQPLIDEI